MLETYWYAQEIEIISIVFGKAGISGDHEPNGIFSLFLLYAYLH